MASRFLMQVTDRTTGEVVQFAPGQAVEKVFVDDCVEKVLTRKVGFFRTTKTVERAIIDGIEQAIHELKAQIRQP